MKRKGPKPSRVAPPPRLTDVLDEAQQLKLAERVAAIVVMRLRADAPHLFTPGAAAPAAMPDTVLKPAEVPHA